MPARCALRDPNDITLQNGRMKTAKTPALDAKEWRKLVDAIPTETLRDLRDRALIATLTYSFARIGAALKMKVEDLRPKGAGWQVRLHEKGGKHHTMPCHHALAEALRAYIDAAGIAEDRKGFLFRTSRGHTATALSDQPMIAVRCLADDPPAGAGRRHHGAGRQSFVSGHRDYGVSFQRRCAGACAGNGGAQEVLGTTKLYDRTKERLTLDEVERIRL